MIRVFTFFILLSLSFSSIKAQTIYVKSNATGANSGNSWTDAYTSLPTALENAAEGADIWIASGTYTTGDRMTSFILTKNINLFGGFIGTETSFDQRDIINNRSCIK